MVAAGLAQPLIANASEDDHEVRVVKAVSPQSFDSLVTSSVRTGAGQRFSLDRWGSTALVPDEASARVMVTAPGKPTIGVELPFANRAHAVSSATGAHSFDNTNGSTTVILPKADGSIQFTSVIDDASAPSVFTYAFELPAGTHLVLNGEGGSVNVLDGAGQWAAGISAPWAKDAHGTAVPTHYEVDGDSLTQIVDHKGADVK